MKNRNVSLDGLKGFAIIAVVLYHLGIWQNGYLGVDVFLVIGGYLCAKSICNRLEQNRFQGFAYLVDRVIRLLPLVLIAGAASLLMGYFGMLPDDYENVCESVVASNIFSENILEAITTKNYWDVSNTYKPLMHMWYVGVLFEFYLVYVLYIKIFGRIAKGKYTKEGIIGLTVLSLVLYLMPQFRDGDKFYYLPFRFFEFGVGILLAWYPRLCLMEISAKTKLWLGRFAVLGIMLLNIWNETILPAEVKLISVVLFTGLFICCQQTERQDKLVGNVVLSYLGQRTYSIFCMASGFNCVLSLLHLVKNGNRFCCRIYGSDIASFGTII